MARDLTAEAQKQLQRALGPSARFHDGQLEAITALVERRARVLVVQRTGWGKSLVYFLATRLLRDRGSGPTILISPLLALIRDQLLAANELGLRAARIDSTNPGERAGIEAALAGDELDLLMISPERLGNEQFRGETIHSIKRGIGLFVVDEAHCISDWGHDFRPDYQRIEDLVRLLPGGVPLLATTATANERVQRDIEKQLGPDLEVLRGDLARDSLHLQVVRLEDQAERLAWLAEYLGGVSGSGIVYTLTTRDADRVSAWLASRGIDAPAYHSKLVNANERRPELEARLRRNDVKALVATIALGMGFDKPDLRFVVHFQRPGSVVFYYQQIGRAGRGVQRAEVVLLAGREDDAIVDYFISNAFPPEGDLEEVLTSTAAHDEVSVPQLQQDINLSYSAIERALRFLELQRVVIKSDGKWHRTISPWKPDPARGSRVTAVREREHERMRAYVETGTCLMSFLTTELDDPHSTPCGRCANCVGAFASNGVDASLVREASRFLRRLYRPIPSRKMWPSGMVAPRGKIPVDRQLHEGRALCIYGDAGWGGLVKTGKFVAGRFGDELVEAIAEMLDEWQPAPAPTWIAAVPSRRDPGLVPDLARRLALRLGLVYRDALVKVRDTAQQKEMQNSIQQARNVLHAFETVPSQVLAGPVLLVDDMVDSRWSLTVCGAALLAAGSGAVVPVVLAETAGGSPS